MDFLQIFVAMHSDCDLWKRAEVACWKLATDVLNEAPETANHANRVAWANAVLLDPAVESRKMKYKILQNATIASQLNNSSDNDVEFVVSGLIDTFATG